MALLREQTRDTLQSGADDIEETPARNYYLVVLCALGLMLIVLLRRGYGIASLVPVASGVLSVVLPWRAMPFVTVFSLAAILFRHGAGWLPHVVAEPQQFSLGSWVLSAATLAYCAAVFRLQCFASAYFPVDANKKFQAYAGLASLENRRQADLVPPEEIALLVAGIPIIALFAQIAAWFLSHVREEWIDLDERILQALALTWIVILTIGLVTGLVGFVQWRRISALEAKIYLQDTVWYETRREQRRIWRWLVWRRKTGSGQ